MLDPYPEFPLLSPLHFKMRLMPDLHIHSTRRDGAPLWAVPCVCTGAPGTVTHDTRVVRFPPSLRAADHARTLERDDGGG